MHYSKISFYFSVCLFFHSYISNQT